MLNHGNPHQEPEKPPVRQSGACGISKKKRKKITNTCAFVICKYIVSNKFCFVKFIFCRYEGGAAGFISRHAGGAASFISRHAGGAAGFISRHAGGAAGFISRHAGDAASFVKFFHLAPQIQPREPLTQGGRRFRPSAAPKAGPAVFAHISPQKMCIFLREKTVIHPDKRPQQRLFLRREQPPAARPNRAFQPGRVSKN